MAILDDRGRLFGRVNIIDAAVGFFLAGLVPLAYGAWVLFRMPVPVITNITPTVVRPGEEAQRIVLQGQHFRPFLRVFVGSTQATYLVESPDRAEVRLPRLGPGNVDLVIFDEAAQLGRYPNALTVSAWPAPPPPVVRLADRVDQSQRVDLRGPHLHASLMAYVGKLPAIYQFNPPDGAVVQLPALEPGVHDLVLVESDDKGEKELVRYAKAMVVVQLQITMSVITRPEIVEMIKRAQVSATTRRATLVQPALVSFEVTGEVMGAFKEDLIGGRFSISRAIVDVVAVKTAEGWYHDGKPLRAGQMFRLEASTYVIEGQILSVAVASPGSR